MHRYVSLTLLVPDGPLKVEENVVVEDASAMRSVEIWAQSNGVDVKGFSFHPVMSASEAIKHLEKVKGRNIGSAVEDWG